MFCSECGAKATGKFCSQCGVRIAAPESLSVVPADPAPPADWSQEIRYDVLIKIPAVRQEIAYQAAHAVKRISGEEFLQMSEKALSPILGGAPLSKVATIAQPIFARMGIGTGQTRTRVVALPIGKALTAVLCSLAKNAQDVLRVQQGADGCVLETTVPSDLWSFQGDMIIHVQRDPEGTRIEAAVKIHGQMYDWGKSRRWLDSLFQDVGALSKAG